MPQRKIIHIDMDCFYAAIEMRDDPTLAGKPVAVGGPANSRGVLCTCNYEARKFGLHSAMPSAHAARLCPDLIILPVNFESYRKASKNIHSILHQYTDLIEPLSLDEAFLDVTDSTQFSGSATLLATDIRESILKNEGLTASAGIAPNKMLAKIASDWRKPNGQFTITPEQIPDFMRDLSVKKLFGVGKVTAEKLKQNNIEVCNDILQWSLAQLVDQFGSYGQHLYSMARGIDDRNVQTSHKRKSLSVERTFSSDLTPQQIENEIIGNLYITLTTRLANLMQDDRENIKTLFVKIKYHDFTTTTIQTANAKLASDSYLQLFKSRTKDSSKTIRLIGLGTHFYDEKKNGQNEQLDLPFTGTLPHLNHSKKILEIY